MPAPLSLEIQDLACVRGGRTVFEHVVFSVSAGQLFALEGPNGAGKTSLLRIVAGLLPLAAGSISIRTGDRAVEDREERGRLCGWLGHQDGVKPQLTVAENARFWAALYGGDQQVEGALERVGLTRVAEAPAQYLSAGQRRRLALARLLVCGRPLWLLDEPFAALDAGGRALVTGLVQAHTAKGGIVIAATHEPFGAVAGRFALPPPS